MRSEYTTDLFLYKSCKRSRMLNLCLSFQLSWQAYAVYASSFQLVALSLDRFFAIVFPMDFSGSGKYAWHVLKQEKKGEGFILCLTLHWSPWFLILVCLLLTHMFHKFNGRTQVVWAALWNAEFICKHLLYIDAFGF